MATAHLKELWRQSLPTETLSDWFVLVSTTIRGCTMPSVCQLFTREQFWHQICGRSTLVRPLLFLFNIKASSSNVVHVDSFRNCYWTCCFELMNSEQFKFGVCGNSLVANQDLWILGYSWLEQEQSWLQSQFMQLVLERVICHYIRRPTSWASMDKFNFTLHNFVSFDLQCRIRIVTLRWSYGGSELQCWGMLYCGRQWIVSVVHTKDVSVVVPSWTIVGGVVAIGDGNSIFGAMEI